MARVFSALLYSSGPGTAGSIDIGGPPSGALWVVRDIVVWNDAFPLTPLFGWQLTDSSLAVIAGQQQPTLFSGPPAHYELRQVLEEGDSMAWTTFDDGWTLRVSGYQLTLP